MSREAFTVRVSPTIAERLREAAEEGSRPITVIIHDAIVGYLGGWRAPEERIAEKQHRRRKVHAGAQQPIFDPAKFNEYGFPLVEGEFQPPANCRAEVGQALRRGKDTVRKFVRQYWSWNGFDPDKYTDAMLEETLRVYAASKGGHA